MFCTDAAVKLGRPFVDKWLNGGKQGWILCRGGDVKVKVTVTYEKREIEGESRTEDLPTDSSSIYSLTYVSVSHHTSGPVSQMLPHVCHQLVDPLHRKGDVVLVGEAIVSQRLCDTFTH